MLQHAPPCPCCKQPLATAVAASNLVGPPREGDLFCQPCSLLVSREAVAEGGPYLVVCSQHEPIDPRERLEEGRQLGVTTLADDEDLAPYFGDEGPSRPYLLVLCLVMKAQRNPRAADIPLGDLVTEESIDNWDLDELAQMLEGHGIASQTRYPVPGWAEIRLVAEVADAMVIWGPTVVCGYSAYVKFVEDLGDWRIHMIGPPVDPARLP